MFINTVKSCVSALSLSSTNFTPQACRDMAAVFPTRIRWMWIRILLCSATWIRILFHILMWIRSQLYISILKNPKQNLSYPKDGSRKCCGFRSRGKKNVDPDPGAPWMRIQIQGHHECGYGFKGQLNADPDLRDWDLDILMILCIW